jgi:hypothetical protein
MQVHSAASAFTATPVSDNYPVRSTSASPLVPSEMLGAVPLTHTNTSDHADCMEERAWS